MLAHVEAVNAQPDVLVLRLQARGRSFCAGFNLNLMASDGAGAGALFERLADAIEAARPVTVAVLQGGVYGGATDLAMQAAMAAQDAQYYKMALPKSATSFWVIQGQCLVVGYTRGVTIGEAMEATARLKFTGTRTEAADA